MIKVLLFIMILFAVVSCNIETPVEKSISNYVQTSFKDPSSYEKISIEVLDTISVAKIIKTYEDIGLSHEQFDKEPKDRFIYYKVSHKYKTKNSFGALMVYGEIVSMDKDFKITGGHGVNE